MTDTPATAPTADNADAAVSKDNLIQKAMAEAEKIEREAKAKATAMLDDAEAEAKEVLANTRTFIAETHADIANPLQFVCTEGSKAGDLLDKILGNAVSCYCCAALRMGLIGFGAGVALTAIAASAFYLLHH